MEVHRKGTDFAKETMFEHLFVLHHGPRFLFEKLLIQKQGNKPVPPRSMVQKVDGAAGGRGLVLLVNQNIFKSPLKEISHIDVEKCDKPF